MHVIQARNVNDAYRKGMQLISSHGVRQTSRAGEVLVLDRPVTTVYERPIERVLFDPKRDANPIFHLMESIWMLAGWRDATWLDQFVSDFSKRFAEDNGEAHGAYGHRWRKHFRGEAKQIGNVVEVEGPVIATEPLQLWEFPAIDQIKKVSEILLNDPTSRQAVMAMWDPSIDLGAKKRDIPCNDMVMFRGRYDHTDQIWLLDTTVLCRSNDIIWGAYGANAVHMSFMAEVVAALCGMKVGRYYQVSNNYHAYTDVFTKMHPPTLETGPFSSTIGADPYQLGMAIPRAIFSDYPYDYRGEQRKNTAARAELFLEECEAFMDDRALPKSSGTSVFFNDVVHPIMRAHRDYWKQGDKIGALDIVRRMPTSDWQLATMQWMGRRINGASSSQDVRSK